MEGPVKRHRFKDNDGQLYDIEPLLGLPPHVTIHILTHIDNVLTLYNFAHVSKAARAFMERYRVFERWDEVHFGPSREIRERAMRMCFPPGMSRRVTVFTHPTRSEEKVHFAFMFVSREEMKEYISDGEIPAPAITYNVATTGDAFPVGFRQRVLGATRITEDFDTELLGQVTTEVEAVKFLYRLCHFMQETGHVLSTPTHNDLPYDMLSFQVCLRAFFDPRSVICARDPKNARNWVKLEIGHGNFINTVCNVHYYCVELGWLIGLSQPRSLHVRGVKWVRK